MIAKSAIALLLFTLAGAAQAEETIVQLTPEQREKVLNEAADRGGDPAINGIGGKRQIHGEVGMAIGTGGLRSMYGTVVAPIGDSGSASFSYENTRFNGRAGRYGRYYGY